MNLPIADLAPYGDPMLLGVALTGFALVAAWFGWRLAVRGRTLQIPESPPESEAEPPAPAEAPLGLAARLRDRMAATRQALQGAFDRIFTTGSVDESALDPLADALILADVGPVTTERLVGSLRARLRTGDRDPASLRSALQAEMRAMLDRVHRPLLAFSGSAEAPHVVLVVGVNGSGKTTTIGKIAAKLRDEGHKVVLAAGDTYRAAAADQLAIWADRSGALIVRREEGADPASVAHDAIDAARRADADVVIIDTAGRLQTRRPLMEELSKIRRVVQKKVPGAPHQTLLVIDGTMGQNALSQARAFHEATPLTGVVVTKLDGTAKGGIVVALAHDLGLPVQLIGIGEKVDDLRPFEPDAFVEALT